MKAALAWHEKYKFDDEARQQCPVRCQTSPECRVIGSTGTEAASIADSITIIALQPLRTLTPSGVRKATTFGAQATWARPWIQSLPKSAEAPKLAGFVHSTVQYAFSMPVISGGQLSDFSHFNRPLIRICLGALFIAILLPIAKITSQVSQSRSATDTAPSISKILGRVSLPSSRCTLKRECYKECAPSGRTVMAKQ